MNFDEYVKLDAMAMAELVQRGEVTALELLELAIGRAEAVNGSLNAIIHPLYDHARKQIAAGLGGPLAGVPMLVKDLFQEMQDAPHHMGNAALKARNVTSPYDSTLVQRWKAAGLVPFGRTNTPEFGAKGVTEPEAWGITRNPWNTDHTPGGSSGGSAASVAAGIVPIAGANDGGGSIRIPAACCGLFGLKPGRGRTPWGPVFTEAMHGIAVNHVVTRSVRDSALVLDLTHGREPGSLFDIAPPAQSYLSYAQTSPGKLRIAFSTESPLGMAVNPEAVKAVEKTVKLLQSLCHEVEEAKPGIDMRQMCLDWLNVWFAQCATTVANVRAQTGCGLQEFEADTLAMTMVGRAIPADEYAMAQARWQNYMIALDQFLQQRDFWLTPTMAEPPLKVGANDTPKTLKALSRTFAALGAGKVMRLSGQLEEQALLSFQSMPYTQLANVTGVPAMSVPLHWCDNGLPLGVQFVGTHGDEGKLLSLAAQLEQAQPWQHRVAML
jgi:amidase